MKSWRALAAALLAALGLGLAPAAGAAGLKEGDNFRTITPPLAAPAERIEVTEFFWYGCPHCFDFEPTLSAWVGRLPAHVVFRRVPALFPGDRWLPGARLYYTLEALGLVDQLHGAVFHAIHVERRRLDDEKTLFEWAAGKGVDAARFRDAWSSPGVQDRLRQARELGPAAGLTGVPAVMVQGRYLALTRGDYADLLATIEQLVERARKETGIR